MRSLRRQVFTIIVLLVFVQCGVAIQTFLFNSRIKNNDILTNLSHQFQIQLSRQGLNSKKIMSYYKTQSLSDKVDQRRQSFAANTYTMLNGKKIHKDQINTLIDAEVKWREFLSSSSSAFHKRATYLSILGIAVTIISLVGLLILISKQVFAPLKSLSASLLDVADGEFHPRGLKVSDNEMGQVQRNFLDMAATIHRQMFELKSLDNAKSEFLSMASHELRTPLTSIKGSLNLLKNNPATKSDASSIKLLEIAETETNRLIRLINDLLDLAKIEARKLPLDKQWCSLEDVIDLTVQSMESFAKEKDVTLSFQVKEYHSVLADKDRLQQILTNLISNAVKHSPSRSHVDIEAIAVNKNTLQVSVKDQGKGLSPDDQEIIFEKFRQVTSENSPLVKGTGLGLTIAKALVEQHGGVIYVTSKPNDGATFYFTLKDWRYSESAKSRNVA